MKTPKQQLASRLGKLDQRCRSCGTTQAASSYCYHCQSRDVEYRTHDEQRVADPVAALWCRSDNRPPRPVRTRKPTPQVADAVGLGL